MEDSLYVSRNTRGVRRIMIHLNGRHYKLNKYLVRAKTGGK